MFFEVDLACVFWLYLDLRRGAGAFDSRRWGAHTTAVDALAVGVGVLTAPGAALASRAAHSLATNSEDDAQSTAKRQAAVSDYDLMMISNSGWDLQSI